MAKVKMKTGNIIDIHTLKIWLPNARPEIRAAIAAYVHRVVADFADEVSSITLYGSQARGDANAESDIDLFVVVRHETPNLRQMLIDLAWRVQFEYNVVISDIIRNTAELKQMRTNRFPYYQHLEQEGILLWRNTSEPTPAFA